MNEGYQQQQPHIYKHLPPQPPLFARSNTLPPITFPDSLNSGTDSYASMTYPSPSHHHPFLTTLNTPNGILPSPSSRASDHTPLPFVRTSSSHSGRDNILCDRGHDIDIDMSETSEFVKKLYKMLEDNTFQHVVSWNQFGDAFVVKDINEFSKSILPCMFNHSNFASFVRELHKFDFHKVKNSDENQYGEHSWMFRHPDFQAGRGEALANISAKSNTSASPALLNNSNSNVNVVFSSLRLLPMRRCQCRDLHNP